MKSVPIHGTNILPLRWFGNFCNLYPSSWAMQHALLHEDVADFLGIPLSKAGYRWWKLYKMFDKPYKKWGTTYRIVDWHVDDTNTNNNN